MTYHGKDVEVVLTGEAKDFFEKLKILVADETSRGRESSFHNMLLNSIKQKIFLLREDPSYGTQIPKNKIPKEYVLAYDVDNLWKINLSGGWRMIYTIRGKEVKVIALVMDIFTHEDYNKKFQYRKR